MSLSLEEMSSYPRERTHGWLGDGVETEILYVIGASRLRTRVGLSMISRKEMRLLKKVEFLSLEILVFT